MSSANTPRYRPATPAENLRIMAARLSVVMSPAEKRAVEEAAVALEAHPSESAPTAHGIIEACANVVRAKHDELGKRSYPPPTILLALVEDILALKGTSENKRIEDVAVPCGRRWNESCPDDKACCLEAAERTDDKQDQPEDVLTPDVLDKIERYGMHGIPYGDRTPVLLALIQCARSATGAPEWHGKLLNLWAEYTGGHIHGSEFNDMVCELVVDNLVASDSGGESWLSPCARTSVRSEG